MRLYPHPDDLLIAGGFAALIYRLLIRSPLRKAINR
jgi:hypothetical protein